MEIEIVILVLISLLTFSFGVSILRNRNKKDKRQALLFGVVLSQFLFIAVNLLTLVFYDVNFWNLQFTRASFAAASLISISSLGLAVFISSPRYKTLVWILVLVQTAWIPLSFTNLLIESVVSTDGVLVSYGGSLKFLYSITTGLTFLYTFRLFYIAYRDTKNLNFKHQIKFILFGGIASFILTFTSSLILPLFGFEFRSLGPASLMVFVSSTFYAISRHRFLKLNIEIGNVVMFAFISVLPFLAFLLIHEINTRLFGSIHSLAAILLGIGESIAFVLAFQWFQKFFNNMFYHSINSDYARTKKLIDNYENLLSKEFDLHTIYNRTLSLINQSLNLSRFAVIQFENDSLKQIISKGKTPKFLHKILPILKWMDANEGSYVDLTESQEVNEKFYSILLDLEVEAIFPIDKKKFLVLFSKSDNRIYTVYEIEFLLRITQILGISLQRADLYQKQKEYTDNLKKEVELATKKIAKQKKLIKKKYEEERDMIGILGHELRTPLTVAKNMNELLMSKVKAMKEKNVVDYDYILEKVHIINDSLQREADIVETTLSASRIDNNKTEIVNEQVDIVEIIEYAINAYKELASKKGLALIFEKPEFKVPIFTSDNAKIQEIVTNLISNAVKYTFKGYVKAKLDIDGGNIYFSVEDSGEGIPEELLSKLGQKFYRVNQHLDKRNSVVRPGGTGLGLYVVKNYVKLLGGELKIKSEVGKGSVFTISLPLKDPQFSNRVSKSENKNYVQADMFVELGLKSKH